MPLCCCKNKTSTAAALGMLGVATGVSLMTVFNAEAHDHNKKEAAQVGEAAPDFTLVDTDGDSHTLSDYTEDGKIVVLEWFNPKCPFVVKHHDAQPTMANLYNEYSGDDVVWFAINSAHKDHGTYGHDAEYKEEWEIQYPILIDESGDIGRAYGARTTPHMYIIDAEGVLRYAGGIDNHPRPQAPRDSEKSSVVNYVDQALSELLAGDEVSQPETRAYGCSVKYGKSKG